MILNLSQIRANSVKKHESQDWSASVWQHYLFWGGWIQQTNWESLPDTSRFQVTYSPKKELIYNNYVITSTKCQEPQKTFKHCYNKSVVFLRVQPTNTTIAAARQGKELCFYKRRFKACSIIQIPISPKSYKTPFFQVNSRISYT